MKLVLVDKKNRLYFNRAAKMILYIVGYTAAFLFVQLFFGTIVVDSDHKILVSFAATCLIYLFDKTIKPILVHLAIPITAVTLGLFYFVINTLLLKLVDIILYDMLDFTSIWKLFFISIALSSVNLVIENLIIKPVMRRVEYE